MVACRTKRARTRALASAVRHSTCHLNNCVLYQELSFPESPILKSRQSYLEGHWKNLSVANWLKLGCIEKGPISIHFTDIYSHLSMRQQSHCPTRRYNVVALVHGTQDF
jgi:hypothetical protein